MRIGQGFDSHQWDDDLSKALMLGGIKFDADSSLKGHSDGDVIIHAVIDGLLGAMRKKDIGTLYPSNKRRFKNIRSPNMLSPVLKNLHKERFSFILSDSKKVKKQLQGQLFDLAFIDGDHTEVGVDSDIRLCIDLQIPLLLFDDYWSYSNTNSIRKVCEQYQNANKISKIKVYDLDLEQPKVALYRNDTILTQKNTLARQIQLLLGKRT